MAVQTNDHVITSLDTIVQQSYDERQPPGLFLRRYTGA